VLLAVKAVDQVEEDLGFEVGQLELVDVVPEQVVRRPPGCRGDHGGYKILVEFRTPQLLYQFLIRAEFRQVFSPAIWRSSSLLMEKTSHASTIDNCPRYVDNGKS